MTLTPSRCRPTVFLPDPVERFGAASVFLPCVKNTYRASPLLEPSRRRTKADSEAFGKVGKECRLRQGNSTPDVGVEATSLIPEGPNSGYAAPASPSECPIEITLGRLHSHEGPQTCGTRRRSRNGAAALDTSKPTITITLGIGFDSRKVLQMHQFTKCLKGTQPGLTGPKDFL